MSEKTTIRVANVSKKFSRSLKHVMAYGAKDIARNIVGLSSRSEILRNGEFWAVDDVSFEVKKGECLGIIGANGSGKSTILKMLNGIYMPDKGEIILKGKVGALIEVGAGFHPMLTGRENIYVNGSILGMSKKEIDKKFNEIVDFADIGDFLDAPVKHYSSGMYVRLGFAIAIHCEPDILLVDEVLAVGDTAFKKKCQQKIEELLGKNVSFIIISHFMGLIWRLCSKALLLNKGEAEFYGLTHDTIRKYNESMNQAALTNKRKNLRSATRRGSGEIRFLSVDIVDNNGNKTQKIVMGDDIRIRIRFKVFETIEDPVFGVYICDHIIQKFIVGATSREQFEVDKIEKDGEFEFTFPNPNIGPGTYAIYAQVVKRNDAVCPYEVWDTAGDLFNICHTEESYKREEAQSDLVVYLPYEFKLELDS